MSKQSMKEKMREQLKKRAQQSQKEEKTSSRSILTGSYEQFSPKAGESYAFDIIPYITGPNAPTDDMGQPKYAAGEFGYVLKFSQHSGLGDDNKGKCICLTGTFRKRCPVCEDKKKVEAEGDQELADQLKPKERCAYNLRLEGENKTRVYDVSKWWSERRFMEMSQDSRYKRKWGEFLFMDQEEGKTIAFVQGDVKTEMKELKGLRFEDREREITDDDVKSAYCLEDLLTNSLPKDENGNIDWDKAYKKIHAYYHAESFDEEIEKPVENEKEDDKTEAEEEKMPWDDDEKKAEEKTKEEREKKKREKREKRKKEEKADDPSEIDWHQYDHDKEGLLKKLDEFPELRKKIEKMIEEDKDEDGTLEDIDPDDIITFYIEEIFE